MQVTYAVYKVKHKKCVIMQMTKVHSCSVKTHQKSFGGPLGSSQRSSRPPDLLGRERKGEKQKRV